MVIQSLISVISETNLYPVKISGYVHGSVSIHIVVIFIQVVVVPCSVSVILPLFLKPSSR